MAKATGLPTCVKFSPQRRKACRARLREDGLQAIRSAIDRVPQSAFLRGEAGDGPVPASISSSVPTA
jgi:hypothetical protein